MADLNSEFEYELDKVDLRGVRCLVRVDLNVPQDPATFAILSDARLKSVVPTINILRQKGAITLLMSHLGRPRDRRVQNFSMEIVRERLAALLNLEIVDVKGPVSDEARAIATSMNEPGAVGLLENLRFDAGEEANDPQFAKRLAELGDFYINDAFGTAHRAHASVARLPELLPSAAGPLLNAEVRQISQATKSPRKPAVAVLGGAKMSDKVQQLFNIAQSFDRILLGGGMTAAFLKLKGLPTGGFEVSDNDLDTARRILQFGEKCEVCAPSDFIAIKSLEQNAPARQVKFDQIEADDLIMDIGPDTVKKYVGLIQNAKTVIWNGPFGYYEWQAYQKGTIELARAIAELKDATTVAGGGSTLSVISDLNIADKLTHVSTGGGAFLKMLAGETLIGYQALRKRKA